MISKADYRTLVTNNRRRYFSVADKYFARVVMVT